MKVWTSLLSVGLEKKIIVFLMEETVLKDKYLNVVRQYRMKILK